MKISVTMQGDAALRFLIEGEHRLLNLDPALYAIAGEVDDRIQTAFAIDSDPVTGTPWPELKPATLRAKQKAGYGSDALENRRILRGAAIATVEGRAILVNNQPDYAKYHQFGTSKIPQRRFVGVSPQDIQQFEDILTRYISAG